MNNEIKIQQFAEKLELLGYSKRTIKDNPYFMRLFCRYLEEKESVKSLADVKPEHFAAYHTYLQYTRFRQGKHLATASVVKRLEAVKQYYRIMYQEGLTEHDYASLIGRPLRRRSLPKNVPTEKDLCTLLECITPSACTEPGRSDPLTIRDRCMLELLYATGIRNEELRTLPLDSVDITERTLFVHGKGAKDRLVPIGDWVIPYMLEYLETARPKLINKRERPDLLFMTKNGRMINNSNLGVIIKKYTEKAGLEIKMTPHLFRHACATHLLKSGADIRYVQELLGHADLSSTQIYTKLDITFLKQAHKRYHPRERLTDESGAS